jgi:CHAD domain-containing protein
MARLREMKVPSGITGSAPGSDPHRLDPAAVVDPSHSRPATRSKEDPAPRDASALLELEHAEVWNRAQKLALQQLHRLVAMEPKVLRDASPKPVHDLRVATRRLQSLVDFLYPSPRPAQVQKLRRRLQRARRALGGLRNQDVMAARISRLLARKRATHREAWEAVHGHVLKLRTKIAARAHRKLTRINLAEVYLRLRQELASAAHSAVAAPRVLALPEQGKADGPSPTLLGGGAQAGPQGEMTPAGRFADRVGELWQDLEARSSNSRRGPGALHALRIAAKRVRYTIEVVADLEVSGSAEALDWLRELQGKLGEWHDAEVLGQTMIELVARRAYLEEHLALAIEIQKLVLRLRNSKARTCKAYLRETFKSPEYGRTAEWVAQWAALRRRAAG